MNRFVNLPDPLKWLLGAAGAGSLVGVGVAAGTGRWVLLVFILALVALLAALMSLYALVGWWRRRKQAAQLGGGLQQSAAAAPRGISAADLAKLDSLRKKFQEGVDAFRSRGKDLYTLPWYLIVGEPGSGKTEAVRHSAIGFPPGMQDELQGAGGTINMNWWFTNHAVLLDTAGRLMFEEVKAGETSEWREFLKLLRKHRPYCPVNGLLLVIPSDSLIRDTADQIAAKAGKIAQQLDVIQRVLDFRFPVYVVISKSDKINGFREFFETLTDPQLQHQMLGWSNPDPLDSPFKPEKVDSYLTQVAERLRRRRLGLLRDPVPESAPRRTDEVDSLYALPNSLLMLAPRLRRYLETIFMPGEWSAKPLFLRGIYFTSSMREGAALDQELAEALGVAADDLPEGKQWERDRAYFLRDLFMEKAFKEKGLVTRATNVGKTLRRNRAILLGCAAAALVLFVVLGWLGMRAVRGSVGDRSRYWTAAAGAGWEQQTWRLAILREEETEDKSIRYVWETNRINFAGERLSRAEIQEQFQRLAADELKGRWTSPGLARSYNNNSKRAQRVMFETGVLKPLFDAATRHLREADPERALTYQPDALVALIKLEADVLSRANKQQVPLDSRSASNLLSALARFATQTDTPVESSVVSAMLWTYTVNKEGLETWPPRWLSATTTNASGALTNVVLSAGTEYFIRRATNTIRDLGTNWAQAASLITALRGFESAENELFAAVAPAGRRDDAKVRAALERVNAQRQQVERLLAAATANELFRDAVSLTNALQRFTIQLTAYAFGAFDRVERETRDGIKKHPAHPIFQMITNRLQAERRSFSAGLTNLLSQQELADLKRFDEQFLLAQGGMRACERRWHLYERAASLTASNRFAPLPRARVVEMLKTTLAERAALEADFAAYTGHAAAEVAAVGRYFTGLADAAIAAQFVQAYVAKVNGELDALLGFPLLRKSGRLMTADQMNGALETIQAVTEEIGAEAVQRLNLKEDANWKGATNRWANLRRVAQVLKATDGKPINCTISLLKWDGENPQDVWRRKYRYIRLAADDRLATLEKTNVGEDQELGKVSLRQAVRFQLFQRDDDPRPGLEPAEAGEWGVLQLIARYDGAPASEGDHSTWLVRRPLESASGPTAEALRLKLSFDKPLPGLDQWPKE